MPTQVMGILNVTPDSFSDGGQFLRADDAIQHGLQLISEGADWIDIGGESSRPGAEPVPLEEELRRVTPAFLALAGKGAKLSIDTTKPEVAMAAVQAGASMINDITGLQNQAMMQVAADASCEVCIMHMPGNPQSMQSQAIYENVVEEVRSFLLKQADLAQQAGIGADRIWIDPGIGFGKTAEQNLELLRGLSRFTESGLKVFLGVSRKSFIGKLLAPGADALPVDERLEGTIAAQLWGVLNGVQMVRVHDVRAAKRSIQMWEAIRG